MRVAYVSQEQQIHGWMTLFEPALPMLQPAAEGLGDFC
jgi:hypothetical protein